MRISTKGIYGLKAMLNLALHYNEEHISVNSIAEKHYISIGYLEQVFSALKKAGLVRSIKGAQGGYALNYSPDKINVGMVLRAIEGKNFVLDDSGGKDLSLIDNVIKSTVLSKLSKSISSIVDSITIDDLVNEYHKRLNSGAGVMYYI